MMEYAKEEVLVARYPIKKDKLENGMKERIYSKIRQNKVLTLFFVMGLTFAILDVTFIYYFFSLLTKL